MKYILTTIITLITFSVSMNAQSNQMAVKAEIMTASMDEMVTFSDDQKTQVYAINMDMLEKIEEERKTKNLEAIHAARKDRKEKIMAVLTESQLAKMSTMQRSK